MGRAPLDGGGAPFSMIDDMIGAKNFLVRLKKGRPPTDGGGAPFARSKEEGVVRSLRKRRRLFFMFDDMIGAKNFCTVKEDGARASRMGRRALIHGRWYERG